jgi:uncharacterized protein
MFRNLFLLIAIIALFWIIKGMIRRSRSQPPKNTQIKDMVQCEQCQSYLPKEDALSENGKLFCCQQHLKDWGDKI